MSILSDEQILKISNSMWPEYKNAGFTERNLEFAKRLQAAVLEAQKKQEPVGEVIEEQHPDAISKDNTVLTCYLHDAVPAGTKLYAAPVVQPDMVMVPRDPTHEMVSAGYSKITMEIENSSRDISDVYRAMIAAAEGKK